MEKRMKVPEGLSLLGVLAGVAVTLTSSSGQHASVLKAADDSGELEKLHREDQADRPSAAVDWSVVGPRDRSRLGVYKSAG